LYVRGFTKIHASVPKVLRGTYAGLGTKEVLSYIKSLGVTSVELLPIHTFIGGGPLLDQDLTNYSGYNARFHDPGLEVILDVVYNHTAEGNERGRAARKLRSWSS
jgi:glycogen operon protein